MNCLCLVIPRTFASICSNSLFLSKADLAALSFSDTYGRDSLMNLPMSTANLPIRFPTKDHLWSSVPNQLRTQQHFLKLQANEVGIHTLPSLTLISIGSTMQRQIAMLSSNNPFTEPWVWFLLHQEYSMVRVR